jgi:hypothetical protein
MKKYLLLLLIVISLNKTYGQKWSFVFVTDPMMWPKTFQNALIETRDRTVNPEQLYSQAEFIVVGGDMKPVMERYRDYLKVFKNDTAMKSFFPVRGNHDRSGGAKRMIKKILPKQDSVTLNNQESVDYVVDWKNARLIVLDQYKNSPPGCLDNEQINWTEKMILSADKVDHIFIFFHEPAFPRHRHIIFSFNKCKTERDAFWNMILKHREKVKAVFAGHTHYYTRIRIADPKSAEANDASRFPVQENGIDQINGGSTGQGKKNNIVRVQIDGTAVRYLVLEAEKGKEKPFVKIDEWNSDE